MNISPKAPRTHLLERLQFDSYCSSENNGWRSVKVMLESQLRVMTHHAEKLELELIEANKMIDIFKEEAKIRQNLYEKYNL